MKKLIGAFIIILLTTQLASQSSDVFAPFVSKLAAVAEDGKIILSWNRSADLEGTFLVYVHSDEITNTNFSKAKLLAELPPETTSFTDKPTSFGPFFYLVLIKDTNNKIYELFIPYRNKTTRSVTLETLSPEAELSAVVTALKAEEKNRSMIITFQSSRIDRNLALYRHTKPMENANDLVQAQLLKIIPSGQTSYSDSPIPGVLYYYAVIDANLVKIGQISFIRGQSSLKDPVEIPLSNEAINSAASSLTRPQPLPLLQLTQKIEENGTLVKNEIWNIKPAALSAKTQKEWNWLKENMLPVTTAEEQNYEILDSEQNTEATGDEYTLALIVNKYFPAKKWMEAQSELKDFLNAKHSSKVTSRTYFYLAQTRYFLADYKDAFMSFMLSYDDYFLPTKMWLTACYKKLAQN